MINREVFDKAREKEMEYFKLLLQIRSIINTGTIAEFLKIDAIDKLLKEKDF